MRAIAAAASLPFTRVMNRLLVRIGALLFACLAHGAWERWPGSPVLERMEPPQPLRLEQPLAFAQNPATGEIVVGDSRHILTFDGANWRAHGHSEQIRYFRALAFVPDGSTLWAGGSNELGCFQRDGAGGYHYQSLTSLLPAEQGPIQEVWACRPNQTGADFVARQKILRWDGTRFQVWDFPTSQRLFPVHFEGALWFAHLESGLYRLGPAGPELVTPKSDMPARLPMALSRHGGKLAAWSTLGITAMGPKAETFSSPALTAAMAEGNPTAITELGNGRVAIGSALRGLLIADAAGNLVRDIPKFDGLQPSQIWALMCDRDGWLWIAVEGQVLRVPASGSPHMLGFQTRGLTPGTVRITSDAEQVWILGDRELFTFRQPDRHSFAGELEKTDISPARVNSILPWHHGVLYTTHREIGLIAGKKVTSLLNLPSRTPYGLQRLRPDDDLLVTLETNRIALLRPRADGSWEQRELTRSHLTPTSAAMDAEGALWLGEYDGGASRHALEGDSLRDITPAGFLTSGDLSASWALHVRDSVWILHRSQIWRVLADGRRERVPFTSPSGIVAVAASPGGRRIYLALDRSAQGTRAPQGVGIIELDEHGAFRGWREPWVPGLHALGGIVSLHASAEPDGVDRLWLGGPQGALHFRTDTLTPWPRPKPPLIATRTEPADPLQLPFDAHAVMLRLQSPEIARRPELRFQTRLLRGSDSAWSAASTQDLFDFSNLTDGAYRFEARTVSPTGSVSEPVSFDFVVRPPWYRSGWAYAGYAAIGLTGVIGAIRYRERRVRARNAELERLVALRTAELEKANAAKDEFLASMSHEIRNPMNGVVGLSAAIDETPLSPEGRHRFELLRHCATHLATLLEDILDFSKLQSGHIELHEQTFAPTELLESVEAITSPESAAAGMPVRSAIAPNMPAHLMGDARRIRQILLNYVTNALKYAGRGTIDITAWARPTGDGRVELTFAVSDEGPGIPYAEQERVFAKFERGAAARSSRIPGTGMGLAVCRQLAEKMGGRVWLESEPGQGSAFCFSAPLRVAQEAPVVPSSLATALQRVRKLALVVDDEEYNRIAHAAHLTRLGFEVSTTAAGAEALARAAENHFDVIFLDYDMPDIKGPDLARRLREMGSANGRQPLLIAATAYTTVEKRAECLAAGMDAFVGKPVSEDRLREALSQALGTEDLAVADHAATVHVEEPAGGYPADPWDNLRVVARNKGAPLEDEIGDYRRACASELESLHEGIRQRRPAVARIAHQLSGRLGFIKAAEAAQLALDLEQAVRDSQWTEASELEIRLAAEWADLQERLTRSQAGRVA
ncbi:MAG: hypothetical protein C0502_00025 [Opitutus sp.]|nr:hypothetical protein [Opitutus sp.]